jgi:hypothetical protein
MNSPILLDDRSVVAIFLLMDGGIATALAIAYLLAGGDPETPPSAPRRCRRGEVPGPGERACQSEGPDHVPFHGEHRFGGPALQRGGAGGRRLSRPGRRGRPWKG